MTTVADVLAKCRNDYLFTGAREQRNKLGGAITDTTSATITMANDVGNINEGSKISVGLEDMYVWSKGGTAKSLSVERGDFGSTAATHSNGAIATINSRFSDAAILRAVNDELASLSSPSNGLFRMRSVDLTFNAARQGYDLTGVTDLISIWDMRYKAVGSEVDWPVIDRDLWTHQRDLAAGEFASGQALFIRGYVDPGRTVRVWYRAPFSPVAALTDDVLGVAGLHAEAHDILAVGAAAHLTAGREVRRNFDESQGDTRRAGEVPPGANTGAWRALQAYRGQRVIEEAQRLARMYPVRLR